MTTACGENTPPGTRAKLHICPAEEFDGWPQTLLEMTPASTVPGADIILNEAFNFVATVGKGYWRTYDILVDSGMVETSTVGEKGVLGFTSNLPFFIIGTKAEKLSFAKNVVNCCLAAMIQTREDKLNMLVLGRDNDPVKVKEIKISTGAKAGDKPGAAYVLEDSGGDVPAVYPISFGINTTPNV